MTAPEKLMLILASAAAVGMTAALAVTWVLGLGDPWRERGPWPAVLFRRGAHAGRQCPSCQPGGFALGRLGDFDTTPGMTALTGWKLQAAYDRRVDDLHRRRARWASLGRGSRDTARQSPARSPR